MRKNNLFLSVFVIGLVIGIIMINLEKNTLLEPTGILEESVLKNLLSNGPDNRVLFWYVLRNRILEFVILVILSTTYLGVAVCVLSSGWYGFAAGVFIGVGVMRYGIKGIFLFLAAVLPQYLLYGPMLYGLFLWCETTCNQIYGKKTTLILWERVLSLILLFCLLFVGCVAESFINPIFIKGFIKML